MKRLLVLLLSLLLLSGPAYGLTEEEREALLAGAGNVKFPNPGNTYQPRTVEVKIQSGSVEHEGSKTFVTDLTPDFSVKAGESLYTVQVGMLKIKYTVNGETMELVPLNTQTLSASADTLDNKYDINDLWRDTDVRFEARDYGVKVSLVLTSSSAPTSFTFQVTRSAKWNKNYELPISAWGAQKGSKAVVPILDAQVRVDGDRETWSVPTDIFDHFDPPIVIDPSLMVAGSYDDATSNNGTTQDTNANILFGKWTYVSTPIDSVSYLRWDMNLPRMCSISETGDYFSFYPSASVSGSFSSNPISLKPDGVWNDDGFSSANYPNNGDLSNIEVVIAASTSETWGAWTNNTWVNEDTDDCYSLVETMTQAKWYHPGEALGKWGGFKIGYGDGADYAGTYYRQFDAVDSGTGNYAKVTFTVERAWPERKNMYGFIYNSTAGQWWQDFNGDSTLTY